MSFAEAIRELMHGRSAEAGSGSGKREAPPEPAGPRRDPVEVFARKAQAALCGGRAGPTGSLQVLTLHGLRAHFGPRWPKVADRVHGLIERTIRANLKSGDAFTCFEAKAYLLVFSSVKPRTASVRTALIAQEVLRRLFGEVPQTPLLKIAAADLDGSKISQGPTRDPLTIIASAVEDASVEKRTTDIEPQPGGAPETERQAGERRPEDDPWRRQRREEAETSNKWRPVMDLPEEMPDDLHFIYAPAWLVQHQMIAAHTCIPARLDGDGLVIRGGAAMPSGCATPVNFSLDLLALRKVVDDLEALPAGSGPTAVVVPVHLQTLDYMRFRSDFSRYAASVPDRLRERLLFEVIGVRDTTPTPALARAVSTLRPLCRDVLLRLRLEWQSFDELRSLSINGVGIDLTNVGMSETELFARMEAFNAAARDHRFNAFVHGVRSRSMLSGAVAAGFRFIDGTPVVAPVLSPQPNRPWTARDVYSCLLEPDEQRIEAAAST